MGILTRLTRGCLRLGVRRWPAELRDGLAQEWLAELAALEREPGNAWRRLTFAVSLAASPLTYDEHGLPSSRGEWWRAPGPVLRASLGLLLAGGFSLGFWLTAQMLLNSLLLDHRAIHEESSYLRIALIVAALAAALTSAYAAVAGWWLGGRAGASARGAGIWRRAGLAVGILGAVLIVAWQGGSEEAFAGVRRGGFATTILAWALVTFAVVVVACRRVAAGQTRRSWGVAAAGALLASVLAPVAAAPFGAFGGGEGRWQIALIACRLLPLTVCAVSFGWAAARPRLAGATATGPTVVPSVGAVAAVDFIAAVDSLDSLDSVAGELSALDGEVRTRRLTTTQVAVTVAAAGAAVLWAIGLVLLQPMSEPAAGSMGGNNTYWARELRWDAIVAVVLAVVVCARARRRATAEALLGGLVWLAADVAFDRAELSHGGISLAAVAAGVAVVGCYRGMTGRGTRHRAGLLVVAAVGTVLSGVSLLTESPTDTEPALNLGSAGASCALGLIAIGAAFSAAPRLSRIRYSICCLGGAVAVAMPWLLRDWYPKPTSARMPLGLGFTALLAICVAVVAWRRPEKPSQWLRYPAVAAGTLLVFPVVFTPAVIALMLINVGGVFTALAGNPPINSADEDVILMMPAVLAGVVLGGLLVIGESGRNRPVELPPD
ncbi:hypothetical protein [Rugosimonospora africana]|uniref:Uncharacterized protein n=1 Tax=Rugosimonospora africana TaxID=556532 RepID=A0A8J3VR58_9ACTN|nr:hypothetical protein [Rugosimonospora africana]GIH15221.1 hypothetical protein Raf01_33930 [Rugosimonospora africana]